MTSYAEEPDVRRRAIETPLDNGYPSLRYSERRADEVRIYEYAGNDAEGIRVYRYTNSEPILK